MELLLFIFRVKPISFPVTYPNGEITINSIWDFSHTFGIPLVVWYISYTGRSHFKIVEEHEG